MEVQLQSPHEHPLYLTDTRYDSDYLTCNKCELFINKTPYYYCSQCKFALHYNCTVALPQYINHPLHPHHPLTLVTGREYCCKFCLRMHGNKNGGSYACTECNFHLDIRCVLLPTITCGKHNQVQPVCHLKPMALVENYDDYDGVDGGVFECYVCQTPCGSGSSTSTFVCTICKRFIHDSCTEFPFEMKSPFDPSCNLSLNVRPRKNSSCFVCHRKLHTFFFQCDERCQNRLKLCLTCTFLRPTIKYPGHDHLLCFSEKYTKIPDQCNAFDAYCQQPHVSSSGEFKRAKKSNFILTCAQCNFNLHLLCGPLPCTIKHKCHIHPLTLRDSIVEDDSGEYYCDACEKKRDPRLPVYYCAECKFIAHVDCVISEVVRALKGDFKDVEFRLVGQRMSVREQVTLNEFKSVTMKDIQMNASRSKPMPIKFRRRPVKLMAKGKQAQVKNGMEFYTSDGSFGELIQRLHNTSSPGIFDNIPLKDLEKFETVNVEGYMISWNYAHILKDLIDKHGDIGADSCLTIENKSLIYFCLCGVIKRMRTTLLVDVTKDLLGDLYACLNKVKSTGFKIDFIYAQLDQILPAYFGLQASTKMDQNIADLERQVSQLQLQIEKQKADLESRRERLEKYKKHRSSEKNCSDFMKECLCKASLLKWEVVGKDLI